MKKVLILLIVAAFLTTGCAKFDAKGFNENTKKHKVTKTIFDPEGFNYQGYNADGYDKSGFN